MDDFEGFKTSVEEETTDVVETAGERELEVEPEDGTEVLQSRDKKLTDEELLLMDEQREWFLEVEPTPGEEAVRTVEMTTKDLEHDTHLVDKAVAGSERIDSNLEEILTVDKMLSNSVAATEKLFMKSHSMQQF